MISFLEGAWSAFAWKSQSRLVQTIFSNSERTGISSIYEAPFHVLQQGFAESPWRDPSAFETSNLLFEGPRHPTAANSGFGCLKTSFCPGAGSELDGGHFCRQKLVRPGSGRWSEKMAANFKFMVPHGKPPQVRGDASNLAWRDCSLAQL